MQRMIMDFNIKFITDNILTDLDSQIDQIKIAIASIKSTNKAVKYIQKIHKENSDKLKESLDNKYFKALRYKGIPWKKLIANKKAMSTLAASSCNSFVPI
jgi:GTP1/Obg family GTP-binding protein